jgi:Uma2 family endonuclease
MGMAAPIYYTAEMVRALPDDGNKYEVVHGELLVTPSPRPWHEIVQGRLLVALGNYLEHNPVGLLLGPKGDISWGDDILVQPDLYVVDLEQARTLSWAAMKTLLLVIEVLSPSTARFDRFTKRRLFQEVGVPLYWIVDCEARQVEVWTPDATFPRVERQRLAWNPVGAPTPFEVELERVFRPV